MIISLRKWRGRIKFLVMFVILVYVFFHMLQFAYDWIRPFDHEDRPHGHAVKVFEQLHEGDGEVIFLDRLMFFYWYGE